MEINDLDIEEFDDPDLDLSKPVEEPAEIITNNFEKFVGDDDDDDDDQSDDVPTDVIEALLKAKGVNPNSVKFLDDTGEVVEKPFKELSLEEQIEILNYSDPQDNYDLNEDEISVLNEMRELNLSLSEYKNLIASNAVKLYLDENGETESYSIDSLSDEELYLTDLKSKIPELTEEEAAQELELAKQNETLFNKKVQGIRKVYKELEVAENQKRDEQVQEENRRQSEEFENIIIKTIESNADLDFGDSSLVLSDDDKNELASFMLDTDSAGVRHIAKALNDPQTLFEMSWYAVKGKEAISQISNYYKQKISDASKSNYNKGYEDAKNGRKLNPSKTVVKQQTKSNKRNSNNELTIHDLD